MNSDLPSSCPPSQREIAKALQLSQATVSLALKHHPRISPEVRERVHTKARELGYRPNPTLSALASKRFGSERRDIREAIAFLRRATSSVRNLEDRLARKAASIGYRLQAFSPAEFGTEDRLREVLLVRGIRGVIVDDEISDRLELETKWPDHVVVRLGLNHRTTPVSSVHLDHFAAIHVSFDEAVKAGFRRIAYGLPNVSEPARRMQQAALGLQAQLRGQSSVITDVIDSPKPDLASELAPEVERILRKPKRHRPQCLIGTGWWVFRAVTRSRLASIPIATIFPRVDRHEAAGFAWSVPMIVDATVDLVHRRLMENDIGTPRISQTIAILPPWRDHPSFRPAP